MKNGKVMLGLLAGAAAGAITGILLAPDKGSVTRDTLSRKGRESVDNLKGRFDNLVETVSDKYIGGRQRQGASATDRSSSREGSLERTRSTASQHNEPGAPANDNSFS